MKLSKFFEFVYLAIGVFFIYEAAMNWNSDRNTAYLYIIFVLVCFFMFFFRRHFRHKYKNRGK